VAEHSDLAEVRARVERGGARKYHEAAAKSGKLFARERIALLIDEGSFAEDGRYANVLADGLPADGTWYARRNDHSEIMQATDPERLSFMIRDDYFHRAGPDRPSAGP